MSQLQIKILADKDSLGRAAAEQAATSIQRAIRQRGVARIIAATGASQFEFLDALTAAPNVDWRCVEVFHLDEYIGIPITHPASFRKYLLERLINKTGITRYHFLDGDGDGRFSVDEIGRELQREPVDLAFVGIGENAHLAFNDPPADFDMTIPTWWSNLTIPVGSSRSTRDGSAVLRRFLRRLFRCRLGKSCARGKSSWWFPMNARRRL